MAETTMHGLSREDADGLLPRFPMSQQNRAEVLDALVASDPEHGIRAVLFSELDKFAIVRGIDKELLPYVERFPAVPTFSFLSIRQFSLVLFKAAHLVCPDKPLMESMIAFASDILPDNDIAVPVINIARKAASDSVRAFLQLSTESYHSTMNFSDQHLERIGSRHQRFHATDIEPALTKYLFVPYFEGILKMFARTGEVEVTYQDERAMEIDIRWSRRA